MVVAELDIRPELLAPNGYLHAATVVGLADTASGYGCVANLPPDAKGFTTIELKCNYLGTARSGTIDCDATLKGASTWLGTPPAEPIYRPLSEKITFAGQQIAYGHCDDNGGAVFLVPALGGVERKITEVVCSFALLGVGSV